MFYKSCKGINERVRSLLKVEYERLRLKVAEQKCGQTIQFSDFGYRSALKEIATSIAMVWFMHPTICFLIANYASIIFSKTGTLLKPNISSIILAIAQIIAGMMSSKFADAFGRKIRLTISLAGSAFGLFTLAAFSYFHENGYDVSLYMWLPVASISLIMFISNAGIIALAHICTIENYPTKVCNFKNSTINFVVCLKYT